MMTGAFQFPDSDFFREFLQLPFAIRILGIFLFILVLPSPYVVIYLMANLSSINSLHEVSKTPEEHRLKNPRTIRQST